MISINNKTETLEFIKDNINIKNIKTLAFISEHSLYKNKEDKEVEVSILNYIIEKLYT